MNSHAHGDGVRRREEILRIVGHKTVHSQQEILDALRKRGFRVTQPTLSRDLCELGLAKAPSGYVAPAALASVTPITAFAPRHLREGRLDQILRGAVLTANAAGNLVVIKTPPASAQPVASALDATALDHVLGTIGGDDTVFVALSSPAAAAAFARHVQSVAGIRPLRRPSRA
jgi:transcriptional regulator of arginine metabolism